MKSARIAHRLGCITAALPCASETLRIIPLLGESASEPVYRLLDDEVLHMVTITEINEQGSVPELKIVNNLEVHVLLLAGQELVGAKQNRVLNTDVMVPPRREQSIPVSCVEQGRWHSTSEHFGRGCMAPTSVRSGKAADIAVSLQAAAGYVSNQSAVWSDVQQVLCRRQISSGTSALHDAFRQSEAALESLRGRFQMPAGCVGMAVLDGDRFLGLDLFDRESSLQYFWQSLLDSYALDWLARRGDRVEIADGVSADVARLLDEVSKADWSKHQPPGAGMDYRLKHEHMCGSALLWDDRSIIHLQVFPARRERMHKPLPVRIRRPYRL